MVQALISQSPDIQKVLAFEGAFEKLFNIVNQEGGVDGGAVASGALTCVDGLLRFNTSNQVGHASLSLGLSTDRRSDRVISERRPYHLCFARFFSFHLVCRSEILLLRNLPCSFGIPRSK